MDSTRQVIESRGESILPDEDVPTSELRESVSNKDVPTGESQEECILPQDVTTIESRGVDWLEGKRYFIYVFL